MNISAGQQQRSRQRADLRTQWGGESSRHLMDLPGPICPGERDLVPLPIAEEPGSACKNEPETSIAGARQTESTQDLWDGWGWRVGHLWFRHLFGGNEDVKAPETCPVSWVWNCHLIGGSLEFKEIKYGPVRRETPSSWEDSTAALPGGEKQVEWLKEEKTAKLWKSPIQKLGGTKTIWGDRAEIFPSPRFAE